ncbi:hypothetical protein GUJ93_ZPchr0008g12301 [Zizania palustris]|uniref:Uncharacterized protein n=1 Tax=Zizania palustris TaxID=103762 RepID=A0A8J5VI46_ZIZPA|nr:hypothetical protein GUJ93_ZPchr0008g12301 [Zizania palustris]
MESAATCGLHFSWSLSLVCHRYSPHHRAITFPVVRTYHHASMITVSCLCSLLASTTTMLATCMTSQRTVATIPES